MLLLYIFFFLNNNIKCKDFKDFNKMLLSCGILVIDARQLNVNYSVWLIFY